MTPASRARQRPAGETWCLDTVAKAMKSQGTRAISRRKFRVGTTDSGHAFPVADNVLDRDFTATKPNEVRLADRSYVATGESFLDLRSRSSRA